MIFKLFFVLLMVLNCNISKDPGIKFIAPLVSTPSAPTLTTLVPDTGTLSPVFSGSVTSYTIILGNGVTTISFTPSSDSGNTITVNGTTVVSGVSSSPINLTVGNNTVTIVVTDQGGTQNTYTILVIRSTDDLASLTISSGTLSPVFTAGTTSYTVSIRNSITSVTVTPTALAPTATITVSTVANTSGVASASLPMNVGANTITIVVTAPDLTTKTYTITVTRLNASVKRIFVTSSSYNGNLGGVAGADTKCNADVNKPADGSTYKAILVDGTNRNACSTTNCSGGSGEHIDWVLLASTAYVRAEDAVSLFTTNVNSIFVFGTMTNSFSSGSTVRYWTGFSGATLWGASGSDCSNFNSPGAGITGRVGLSNSTSYTSIRDTASTQNCNDASQRLLCAEQ